MIMRAFIAALSVGVFVAGCTAPVLPPDGADHPANPQAPAAAAPVPSQTLALAGGPASPATAPAAYSCPHHPEVVSNQPGDCPKCGMALTPKPATRPAGGHDHSGHQGHSGPDHSGHPGHSGHQGHTGQDHSGHDTHSGHGGHGGHR